ncbi:MAG: response regulator [Methanoregula sp.]
MTTVLIVDDNPDIRELFAVTLVSLQYSTLTAPGGLECLEMLTKVRPDIILLDVMMWPIDGWQTLKKIKSCPDTSSIPVIMITGKDATYEEQQKFSRYYADYITKPVTRVSLQEIIEKVLDTCRDNTHLSD